MTVKQVIVMRKDLNMRKGKMIAQGAHASVAFISRRLYIEHDRDEGSEYHHAQCGLKEQEKIWLKGSFTKVCVSVDSEEELLEIYKAAEKAELEVHLITDNGLTEFGGVPTKTCLAIGPDKAEKIDKITGHLKLL